MYKVDFSYAFAPPHTITLSRPSGSDKTILSVDESGIEIQWTWQNLKDKFPLAWTVMKMDVTLRLTVSVDGNPCVFSSWKRQEDGIPAPVIAGESEGVRYTVRAVASDKGDIFELSLENLTDGHHSAVFALEHTNGWVISNKGFIDGKNSNVLLLCNDGRADRMTAYACGADEYPVGSGNCAEGVPMGNAEYGEKNNPAKTLFMSFSLEGGCKKKGWWIRPYAAYFEDGDRFTQSELEKGFEKGYRAWKKLLGRGMQMRLPDSAAEHCFKSCLADLFVMREKLAGKYWGITCGTGVYRSCNASEPAKSDMLLEQLGYEKEALQDLPVYLDGQDVSGCWAYSKGWAHEVWLVIYNNAQLVMNHYLLSGDRKFLEKYYENMKRSALWNGKMRDENRKDPDSPAYGLLPRGMGDCGLMNGSDYYGWFYPHNCMAVAADGLALQAAEILGKKEDADLLRAIYERGKRDVVASIRKNAVQEGSYRWIPATFDAENSSMFGCLYAYYPCAFLDKDDPLILGTLQKVLQNGMSGGGLPLGTGWLKDGIWAAMALDNFAASYLEMERYDDAAALLYPVLNHASPFVTWCEERGKEAGSNVKTGDRQHLWTPLSVCRYIRDALVYERKNSLDLLCGIPRQWLADGNEISFRNAWTYYGKINLSVRRIKNALYVHFSADREQDSVVLHLRIPETASKWYSDVPCTLYGERAVFENTGRGFEAKLEFV